MIRPMWAYVGAFVEIQRRNVDTCRDTTSRESRLTRFPVRHIEKGLTVLRVRMRIRPMLSNQPFLPTKAVVLSQLLHQTYGLHLRERGLIPFFPHKRERAGPTKPTRTGGAEYKERI